MGMGAEKSKPILGKLGPRMMTVLVRKHALERYDAPPWRFSPLG